MCCTCMLADCCYLLAVTHHEHLAHIAREAVHSWVPVVGCILLKRTKHNGQHRLQQTYKTAAAQVTSKPPHHPHPVIVLHGVLRK